MILISFIPLAVLLYYLTANVFSQIESSRVTKEVYEDVKDAEVISNLIHQIQTERGFSVGYVSSGGKEDKNELFKQREETDKARQRVEQMLENDTDEEKRIRPLEELVTLREQVNNFSLHPDTVSDLFSQVTLNLIEDINQTTLFSQDAEIKNLLQAHMFVLYSKEYLGQVRGNIKGAIVQGGFNSSGFAQFAALRGRYQLSLNRLRTNASEGLAKRLEADMQSTAALQSRAMMDSVFYRPEGTRIDFSDDEWWFATTSLLSALKGLEDYSTDHILNTAETKLTQINASVTRNIAIAVLVVIIIVVLLFYTIRVIVSSILEIKNAADRMTKGEVDLELAVASRDEIGALADSFGNMIQVSREYATAADTIGNGNYAVEVNVRGKEDKLGVALAGMRDNLRNLSEENERRTWLLTGTSELNDKMRGEKAIRELAQEVINQLSKYMNAQIGAVYINEGSYLTLAGSYAFHHRKENTNEIKFGQGLVGQAALEKKTITFSDIPDDYIKINSGLGNTAPKNILIYPFFYEGEVKGVIELGSAEEFSDIHRQLLDLVAENVGIAFNASESRTKLQELLEETQKQAEELEAQQEELKQTNEELEEKTGMLERSEAELKAQQEELQQTNEELEEKANLLEDQKERLEIAKMDIETKARELEVTGKYKSEFLANMSHELRTPLNSILILAQIMSENKSKVLGEKEMEYARNIYNSGADLLSLINEILDLSKVEAGRIELEIENVEVKDVINSVQSTFKEISKNKLIDFDINYNENLVLNTDKQRLEQILRNLLSNAFKFTDKNGKISLDIQRVSTDKLFDGKKLGALDEVIAFSVADSGIGIPESKLGIVFEAFQQADGSTKRKYGGTGLGLSISRELANALGGEIRLESEEGKGSTFTLYLPLKFDPNAVIPTGKRVEVKSKEEKEVKKIKEKPAFPVIDEDVNDDRFDIGENDKVVLIVEDDKGFADILLDFVRERDYKGIIAYQGSIGLSLARYYHPDAIILDMKLPVMNGSEVLRQLKNDPDLRHIPVQIVSGHDHKKEGLELGAFGFIRKPMDADDLKDAFDKIEEFVSKKLKKLLVVEDDQTQSKAIRELIGNGDVKSFSAYTAIEALETMGKDHFDCVIIDLGLPDMSGFELMEKIKADDALKSVPIIVYTGRDLTKQEAAKLEKLANTVVLKTAESHERLLDETTLFLHRVESKLPEEKQQIIRKLHKTDEVLKGKKVLLVDDDIRNIFSLTNALQDEGLECVTAENGKLALDVLKQNPDVDIVLMDVMMPEMDGYEATREIRKIPKHSKLPIVALTAKAMKGDREKCLEAGMSDYVSKPVNIEQLLSLMRVWLYS